MGMPLKYEPMAPDTPLVSAEALPHDAGPDRLRVMIVDDEKLIRGLIRMRVDWAAIGMEIAAEAASAGEALAMLDTVQPDIIFTDICMPAIDGIAFSRMVMERNPAIRIVVVTGHDEFEYAKRCIKIGVSDFLLKPLRADELKRTAEALRDKILAERRQDALLSTLQHQQQAVRPRIQEDALRCLLTGCGDAAAAYRTLRETNAFPPAEPGRYQVVLVAWTPVRPEEETEAAAMQRNGKAHGILQRLFHNKAGVFLIGEGLGRIAIVSGQADEDLDTYGQVMLTQLLNGCHAHVSIGISAVATSLESLSEAYREAGRALAAQTVLGRNRVIRSNDLTRVPEGTPVAQADRMSLLSKYLRAGLSAKATALMEEGFATLMPADGQCLALMRREALNVVLACEQANHMDSMEPGEVQAETSRAIEHTLVIDNLPEMRQYLSQLIEKVSSRKAQDKKTTSGQLVGEVLAYVTAHLSDATLSLAGTAATFFVSPSHLSRLFRKETGRSFVEHVTRERMEKAFTLVTESTMKSCEIGRMVGIDDPHYFSILFKKHTGMTVHACRKGES
jgi:two-component system response regulator YesN